LKARRGSSISRNGNVHSTEAQHELMEGGRTEEAGGEKKAGSDKKAAWK
jgi:hypothetical protein